MAEKKDSRVPSAREIAEIMAANMRENQKDPTFLDDRDAALTAAAKEALARYGLDVAVSPLSLEDAATGACHVVKKAPCVLGRDAAADLRLDDITVARRHARLTLADGRWSIEDAGSAGGTYVNGEIVRAARPLDEGDVVQVAGVRLVVRLGAAHR